ncbi:MAG: GNAT family N-acyltransferase [Paracoccaceae bacterium]
MIDQNPHLIVRLAQDDQDRWSAERLRYRVFVQELGGDGAMVDHVSCRERDSFDAHAQHLILVDSRCDPASLDHVVGVYRLMDGAAATSAGQYYSETEYDLTPLRQGGRRLLELGRSCIAAEHRRGMALYKLWDGLAAHILKNRIEVLFGVASFYGVDAALYARHLSYLHQHHLAPADLRVTARPDKYLAMAGDDSAQIQRSEVMPDMPPLIKSYLRLGGFVGEGAFVDRDFNTTDIFMIVDVGGVPGAVRAKYVTQGAA